ncbi:filamentous hemagglutinin N-terminal domain-containing protein [Pectinatus brassicae]|uniref:Filamentous hemagglutinin family protein n=1 Tax=Pectinatus brassicae TaxID=862415 RepID=A0A840UG06_9FIRM|nr:filamentous hemagglutinin N-terminal domain-containing protein [Pectinatus brassicae]MBB5336681.1 filamentous hemagglutinin family protein [Pectinatus brassicae]
MKCIQKEGIFFKAVATVLAYIQFTTCAYAADITPDKTNGKNPGVTQAANGLTVVNIRTPDGHGLSHNQYKNLQVGAKGVIFNNSGQMSTTKLAGIIMGNYNLAGNSHARVILNEVTGTNPTTLNGYMEVAGNRAELIIANTNGISGNNFGYINTSRAVLTTGVPQITPDGRLDGFRVSQGEVSINGQGLDASTVDKTDILAQAVQVNAGIWVKDLNVVTGNNKIDYASGKVTGLSSENKGVSLDVAALGGMYANSIKLIGTAQGVGVNNAGQLSATAGTITINQNGDVINSGKLYSTGDMAVQSNSVDQAGTGITYTQSNLSLNSGNITTNGVIKADKKININAADIKQAGAGDIEAGTLNIASSSLNNKGAIKNFNQSDMVINTGVLNTDNGSIESNGSVLINAGSYSGQKADLKAVQGALSITSSKDITLES